MVFKIDGDDGIEYCVHYLPIPPVPTEAWKFIQEALMSDSSSSEGCYPQRPPVPRCKVEEAKDKPGCATKQAAIQVGDSVIGTVEGKKAKINQ